MRYGIILVILFFSFGKLSAQNFEFDLLKYKGLGFMSSKAEIIEALGQPNKVIEPNYECGFLSSDEQGKPFFSLKYEWLVFTGNKLEGYLLEEINLKNGVKVNYGKAVLSNESDLDQLIEVFGMEKFGNLHDTSTDSVVLFEEGRDDGIRFSLTNGKLTSISYMSPC